MNDDAIGHARGRMLEAIAADARATASWTGRERLSERVMAAMAEVPRHAFTPGADPVAAYQNRARPIGHGQTISQPFIVALMTDLLDLEPHHRVLEIGTGSGYQAAVLSRLAATVHTVETVLPLAREAATRLMELGHVNVTARLGDGFEGWPEEAPFDAVIVTAAPPRLPRRLAEQLAPNGRMAIPLGRAHGTQTLSLVTKDAGGRLHEHGLLPVAFVPMVPSRGDEAGRG